MTQSVRAYGNPLDWITSDQRPSYPPTVINSNFLEARKGVMLVIPIRRLTL
jgi:hypothetical protein